MPMTSPPPLVVPSALAVHTGYLLRLGFLRAGQWAEVVMPEGMSPKYYGVLTTLSELGPQSQQDLAGALHVNRTMMVELIDAMESKGLVERHRDPSDRRCYALLITPAGKRAIATLKEATARGESGLTQGLTENEYSRIRELLRRIVIAGEERQTIPAALNERTGYLISAAHFKVRERFEQGLRGAGITPPHFGVLATLDANGPSSQQALARELCVTPPAVLQLVDQLESDGLVERRRNVADRRSYALQLTEKGRATLRDARAALAEVHAELAEMVGGADEQNELHELMLKLLSS
jgi:DNA-binding MarR family transcriptional regulator